ncbi:MAG: MFS transporter [Promethearchaeota archaeon]|jgi:GPH family glycoside/pentoside/hexuronide:cation symporter
MSEEPIEEPLTTKEKFLFGLSSFPDQFTYQIFQFLIFTFYFTVIKIPTVLMLTGYILWGVWNAINDPVLGALSERTKHRGKWGKRRFYLMISIIPLCIMMVMLFFVPFDTSDKIVEFFYFLITIIVFEFFYTLFDVNVNALFPEMFPTEKKRAATNLFIKIILVVALILASLLPGIIVPDLVPGSLATPLDVAGIKLNYLIMSIVAAIITIAISIPFLKWGVKEKVERVEDFEKRPSFMQSLKFTLKNKTFVKFVIANTMLWYCYTILPLILPIYAEHVLLIEEGSFLISIALLLAFLVAAATMPLHRKLGFKIGMRNELILSMAVWIGTLFPFFLISGAQFQIAFILITGLQGFSLAGAFYLVDIIHADIIDEDALKFGVKRSASYYGINAFIHRISIILVIATVIVMFGTMGWDKQYDPVSSDPFLVELGLKAIIWIFPAIALTIGVIAMKSYGLHGERLENLRKEIEKHPELKPN